MSVLANRKQPVKPRKKPARSIRLVLPPNGEGRNGVVKITVGKESQDYFLSAIPSDWGRAFVLEKVGDPEGTAYSVNVNADAPLCDCKGHARWHRCKHVEGLAALVAAGRL
jgi:hypothetical protein